MLYPNINIRYQLIKNNNLAFQKKSDSANNKSAAPEINVPALTGSVIGTLIPMIIVKKNQKTSLLKIDYKFKEMMFVGTGAILGGLMGGIITDKKEKIWAKVKEANFQLITNLFLPTLFVDQLLKFADKKFPKNIDNIKNKMAKVAAVIAGIGAGMKIGEFITNKLNSCIDKNTKQQRKLAAKDILLHVDDVPIALTLSEVPLVDKILPFCFIYSGYQAGK